LLAHSGSGHRLFQLADQVVVDIKEKC